MEDEAYAMTLSLTLTPSGLSIILKLDIEEDAVKNESSIVPAPSWRQVASDKSSEK